MTSARNREIFWFCLTLALAISLASLGGVILYDFVTGGADTPGRISLSPVGGAFSILTGFAFLALIFERKGLATGLGLFMLAVTIGLVLAMTIGRESGLQSLGIKPVLLVIVTLIAAGVLAAMHLSRGWIASLIVAPVLFVTGLLSLMSHWHPALSLFEIGSIPESTLVVSPLIMLVGVTQPFLFRLYHRDIPVYSRSLILAGTLGILITTVTWHAVRLHNSDNLVDRAQTLARQLAATTATAYDAKMSLIGRLAERWTLLDRMPSEEAWQQEVSSYLRDFPELRLIAILDQNMRPVRMELGARDYRAWLAEFLNRETTTDWLLHVVDSTAPHLSRPMPDDEGRAHAVIAAPVTPAPGVSWPVLAVVDLRSVYEGLSRDNGGALDLAISQQNQTIFDTSPELKASEKMRLASTTVEAAHDSEWRIDVYMATGTLPSDELYVPPLIFYTGLGLSFLVMLIHLFWRDSERRSKALTELNDVLNFHLEEERALRHTNERIMEFSRDILCSISPSGRFLTVSPASFPLLGYTPDELKGQHHDLLLLAEDRDSTVEEVRRLASGESDRASGFRTRLRHRAGHTVTISWTAEWSREDNALFCVGRDISDELMAETLTRERDQFFSLSPDMFSIVDLNSHFFEVNAAFVKTLGYTREQLLGTSYMALVHTEDRQKVIDAVESLTRGVDIHDLFIRAVDSAGSEHWLQINAILSADELIYVVARDITEALKTQERLKQSESLLRIAEKTALIGGWTIEVPSGRTDWTAVMFDLFELPPGKVPEAEEGLDFYIGESRQVIASAIDLCIRTGIPFDEEVQFRTATGRQRWARAIGHAVKDSSGEIIRVQGGFQDVTASRQAMEQIRRFAERQANIFESITDAFFTVDREWRITYVNRRSEDYLNKSRDELLGHSLWEMYPEMAGTEFDEMYRRAMSTGESVSFEAYFAPLGNWLEVSAYPSDEGLAVYYRSIHERKEAQWKLEAAMDELERSNRELQDFAFVASHDLQEPLRKIRAFSDRLLVKSDQFGPDEQDYLKRMQSAAARMQNLIMDLLSYSRVTTRARSFEPCDTQRIVLDVLQDMETSIASEQANIELTPLPPVEGDATQLRQVFQNLISNAIKFHEPGQPPTVMIYPEGTETDVWTLVVSDNGIGFDPKYAEKIFHPFQRLHKRETYGGTGIGMAIVRKILDRHGAEVSVESAPGKGTTFRIQFTYPQTQGETEHEQC
jgi:hypothetical protein